MLVLFKGGYGVPFVKFILHALYEQINVFCNSKTKWQCKKLDSFCGL